MKAKVRLRKANGYSDITLDLPESAKELSDERVGDLVGHLLDNDHIDYQTYEVIRVYESVDIIEVVKSAVMILMVVLLVPVLLEITANEGTAWGAIVKYWWVYVPGIPAFICGVWYVLKYE